MTPYKAILWLQEIERDFIHGGDEDYDNKRKQALEMAIKSLEEHKVGKWIKTGGSFRCSECMVMPEFRDIRRLKYCPNCGAEMRGYENKLLKG